MRVALILALVLLAGCSEHKPAATEQGKPVKIVSAEASDAVTVVERYFALLKANDYNAARQLWGRDGADSGGSPAAFAGIFAPYAVYDGRAGEATEIRTTNGEDYVVVTASLDATLRDTGKVSKRAGSVSLKKRDGAPGTAWRIWGTDLRSQH